MRIELRRHANTFATRERARELVAAYATEADAIEVSMEAVMASPSFLAELLVGLSKTAASVTLIGADEFHEALISRLIQQLRLPNVRIAQAAR